MECLRNLLQTKAVQVYISQNKLNYLERFDSGMGTADHLCRVVVRGPGFDSRRF
jgi:hypothetical protein